MDGILELLRSIDKSPVLASVLALVNDPAVPWTLAFGIIGWAVYLWIRLSQRLLPLSRQIGLATKDLGKTAQEPREFAAKDYDTVRSRLAHDRIFRQSWREFEETLILPEPGDDDLRIRNTGRPSVFFSEATLIAPRANLRLFQSVPNMLVGIGLLFTFIGLVAALYFASRGFEARDAIATQKSLSDLLHAATFKFVTSVAGLFSSLMFSWGEKHVLHKLNGRIDRFCQLFEERLAFITPEQIAVKALSESRKQSVQLERFNTDLAMSIAQALDGTKLASSAADTLTAVNELGKKIDALGDRFGDKNQQALDDLLRSFSDKLTGGAGANLNDLAMTVKDLIETFKTSSGEVADKTKEAVESMQDVVSDLNQRFSQVLETMQSSFTGVVTKLDQGATAASHTLQSGISTGLQELGKSLTGFDAALTQFRQMVETLKGVVDAAAQSGSAMTKVHQALTSSAQQLNSGLQALTGAGNNLALAQNALNQQVQGSHQAIDQLKSLAQGIQTSTQTLQQTWDQHQQRFDNVDRHAGQMFDEINKGLQAYTQQVKDFVAGLDASLVKATGALAGVIAELDETVNDLTATVKQLAGSAVVRGSP